MNIVTDIIRKKTWPNLITVRLVRLKILKKKLNTISASAIFSGSQFYINTQFSLCNTTKIIWVLIIIYMYFVMDVGVSK